MTIEERLEKTERELGRLKRHNRWLLGAILLLAGGLVVPTVFETTASRVRAQVAGTAKEIHANKIVLDDEFGKARIVLVVDKIGPSLHLFDKTGKSRVMLSVDEIVGPTLSLYDEAENARVMLTVSKDGSPNIWLADENGKGRVDMAVPKEGPRLRLWDENSKTRAMLDEGSLVLADENGKVRAVLAMFKNAPVLSLFDENCARLTAGKTKLISPDGKTIEYPESSLILFGPDGKVIWSAIK